MILTVTPNVSIDRTYTVPNFGVDRINRPEEVWICAGGKGINAARVLRTLGRSSLATGFAGGVTGNEIRRHLDSESIPHDFVTVSGESRTCIKIMDPSGGTQTEINERGPEITEEEIHELSKRISSLSSGCDAVALCGDCPPGVPAGFYAGVVEDSRRRGIRVFVDASGDNLREAVKASPYMVKPNVTELCQLAGVELCTLEEISRAAKSMKQFGIAVTAVTMGRSGAIVTDGVQVWQAVPPEIDFASAVGSGDAFLAAFIDAILASENLQEALVAATAAGAANATTYRPGFVSKESIIEARQGVTLSRLE